MATEQFTITRRPGWTFLGSLTVTIECDPLAAQAVKIGLAARAAFKDRADLYGANLRGADLSGADLSRADLYGADLSRADLYGADLRGADLSRADLSGADLRGADLSRADLSRADLYGANLSGADLSRADLYGANLRGADLSGANLRGADLRGADLRGADLSGADLYGADLRGADLSRADLYGDKIKRLIARLDRMDGYQFAAFELESGGVKIKAGCRWFTPAEYRAHVAKEYPGTAKAAETLAILDFIEAAALRVGVTEAQKVAA